MKTMKKCKELTASKFVVVMHDVFIRGFSRDLETFMNDDAAWGRVRRLTVESGGGGKYYTVEERKASVCAHGQIGGVHG